MQEPLNRLVDIPVDEYELHRFLSYVESHGVTFKVTATRGHDDAIYGRGVHYFCTVEFPPGTYRVFEEENPPITPYTVYIPEKGTMKGALVKRNNAKPGEAATRDILCVK